MGSFSHLHVHTEYSPLDGQCKLEELIVRAKELGQQAIAITDHGGMYGLWKAQKLGDKHNVKIILGEEFYFDNGHIEGIKERGHLVLLAKNNEGLRNLFKLQELAYTEGFYYKPRITMQMLKEHSGGLICLSACLANVISQHIMKGNHAQAIYVAKEYKEIFGEDFYLEVQTNTLMEQFTVNKELVRIGEYLNIELVVTNDIHYVYKEDADVHEVLLALNQNKKMDDPKRWKFTTNDFWLKSEDEMREGLKHLSDDVINRAINNTCIVADKCNARIETGHYLPKFPFLNRNESSYDRLRLETFNGFEDKLKDTEHYNAYYRQEVEHELDVINRNGYSDYFLIVQDYIRRARNGNVLVGPGRGSGAGSKSAYCLDITRVEPKQYNLLFERFLADGREPDIDTDFSDIDEVFELMASDYGWENMGRIVSFGTLAPKAVTRKILNIFNHSEVEIKRITGLLPEKPGLTFSECLQIKEYVKAMERFPYEWKCVQRLQGNVSHTSMHAGGIVIWNSLSDVLPVKTIHNKSGQRIKRVVCFDMDDLHDIGFFKFDILGLSTLETLELSLKNIKSLYDKDIDLLSIDLEDKEVMKSIASGDVMGIFQLEEQSGRVMEQSPQNFRDIIAINALIRPGTGKNYFQRRNGQEKYGIHPMQRSYMEETYGDYVYQEQYMLDAHTFAGWDIAYADKHLRKNKDIRNDTATENKFKKDCKAKKLLTDDFIDRLWERICEAVDGGYAFNKSHSACYAVIAVWEAWLKYYYPTCFYSALLTKHGDNQDKVSNIIAECKRKNITILPPDINISDDTFIPTKEGIRYRITTIKNVGDSAIKGLYEIRPIGSLYDLLERRDKSKLKKNVVESLIKAGVFDFEDPNRQNVMYMLDMYHRKKTDVKNNVLVPLREYNKLEWEKESLGMYLSAHPMEKYAFKSLDSFGNGNNCLLGGIVDDVAEIVDRKGRHMAFVTISNQYGRTKCLAFANQWNDSKLDIPNKVAIGNTIMIRGKVSGKDCIINSIDVIEYAEI